MANFIGNRILFYNQVDSTNRLALSKELADIPAGTVIVAETQESGVGRHGRKWLSPQGGVYFSVVLEETMPLTRYHQLSLLSALAVLEISSEYVPIKGLKIKWPNDVLYETKKICGILVQSQSGPGKTRLALGIGINLNSESTDFPTELRKKTVSISEIYSGKIDYEEFLYSLLERIESYYFDFLQDGFVIHLPRINKYLFRTGLDTRFNIKGINTECRIVGINPDASLKVLGVDGKESDMFIGEIR